jgi:hypothetical protein
MAMREAVVSANFKFLTLSGFCRSPVLVREERLKWYNEKIQIEFPLPFKICVLVLMCSAYED